MKKVMFTKHLKGLDLRQIIAGLKDVGLDGADLCTRPDYPINPENCDTAMSAAAEQFADAGLTIEICTTPGDFNDPHIDYAEKLFSACAEAGVPRLKLGYWHFETDYWRTLDDCRAKLDGFQELAAKYGVKVLVHNHSGSSMGVNASAAMRIVEGFDPRHVGVFADPGHLSLCGEPIPMALDICWKHLECLALKDLVWHTNLPDMRARRSARIVPFGLGYVEWETLVTILKERNFDGVLSFHCEYGGYPPDCVLDQCRVDKLLFEELMAEA